jgi:hypothetical protein
MDKAIAQFAIRKMIAWHAAQKKISFSESLIAVKKEIEEQGIVRLKQLFEEFGKTL